MGIQGLLPFLQDSSRSCHISEFRGKTVAVDTYCWLHKGVFACADKLVRGATTDIHVKYCLKYIRMLQAYNIKPILVFDGQRLAAKKNVEIKRREQRNQAQAQAFELIRLGKTFEAQQYFRKCVDITHAIAFELIRECRRINVDCIVAPYEADAQLAFFSINGIADIIITEDSDLILFGCQKIVFKLTDKGNGVLVEKDKLQLSMKMKAEEYTFDKFRHMCIMSGCDYLDSLPGIGLKKALKAVALTHDPNIYNLLPRLPRYVNSQKLVVPPEYIENFKIADATLRHQVVFDPLKRKRIRLTDPDELTVNYLHKAGEIWEDDMAFQLALGNVDPLNLKVMDNWNPDEDSGVSNSIWSKNGILKCSLVKKLVVVKTNTTVEKQNSNNIENFDSGLLKDIKDFKNTKQTMEVNGTTEKISETNIKEKTDECNPFLKVSPRRLSKFERTNIDNTRCVRSRFFFKPETLQNSNLNENTSNIKVENDTDGRISPVLNLGINVREFVNKFKRKRNELDEQLVQGNSDMVDTMLPKNSCNNRIKKLDSPQKKTESIRFTRLQAKNKTIKNQPTLRTLFNKMSSASR